MNSLTPFVRHALEHRPGASGKADAASSLIDSPLGTEPLQPPAPPDRPGTQLPPPQVPLPGQTPHPDPAGTPQSHIPITDGTPTACRQKNARSFLQGDTPGVMAQYAQGLFGSQQRLGCSQPAPLHDTEAVQALVDWREDAPYG